MEVKKCKACGADIVWVKTKSGRAMPCDAKKVDYQKNYKGSKVIVTDEGDVVRGEIITPTASGLQMIIDGQGYISHFATCPCAEQFKKK